MVEIMYEDMYEVITLDPFPVYTVSLTANSSDPPELRVTVTYPSEDYPLTAPCTAVAESISKNRRIQVSAINHTVAGILEENLGMHTVVMALQQFQEFLLNVTEEEDKADLIRRGEQLEAAATKHHDGAGPDPTIRLGTAVTKELFGKWSADRAAARLKAAAAEEKGVKVITSGAVKLTGRQLWDNSVASAAWELFTDNNDDAEAVDFDMYDVNEQEGEEEEYDLS